MTLPPIIQGGMGAAVSNWRLARAVSSRGHLGVVSGTGIDTVFVRRLQDGDPGGHMRRGIAAFPLPDVRTRALERWFIDGGRRQDQPYRLLPLPRVPLRRQAAELLMLAAFVEIWLAREGHSGPVGINLLTKIQIPTIPTLYGAMLAGVDVVLMGAGIPREIPAILDGLAQHEPVALALDVEGRGSGDPAELLPFDPGIFWSEAPAPTLTRPAFLPIVASTLLATVMARKASRPVEGLVIEGPTAGGHNAPPRGQPTFTATGEPVYGDRDVVDLDKVAALGLPFWLAGGTGRPGALAAAHRAGAAGIQVGTLFAFCDESGIETQLKRSVLAAVRDHTIRVRTDPRASPTGYPFKLATWPGDPADGTVRDRLCDLGYLRAAYRRPDGGIGFRCPGEPEALYVGKGGLPDDTVGRRCLCNALLAVIGHPQPRAVGAVEAPLVTAGDDLVRLGDFLGDRSGYSAAEALEWLERPT